MNARPSPTIENDADVLRLPTTTNASCTCLLYFIVCSQRKKTVPNYRVYFHLNRFFVVCEQTNGKYRLMRYSATTPKSVKKAAAWLSQCSNDSYELNFASLKLNEILRAP